MNTIIAAALADLTVQETVTGEYLLLLSDRNALPNHPALLYVGDITGTRSNVIKVPHAGLNGYTVHAPVADGASIPVSQFFDGSSTVTVVRQGKAYGATDLARMVAGGFVNPTILAEDAVSAAALRMTDMVADIVDGFNAQVNGAGQDLDASMILAATGATVVNNVPGPYMGLLHGQGWSDLVIDVGLVAGGTIQWQPATAELIKLRGGGFQGNWLGVDWFVSNRVVTTNGGADRAGAIWGRGGVLWADGTPPVDDSSKQMLVGRKVLYELQRAARAGETEFVSSSFQGASKGLEAGVTIIHDA